MILGIDTSAGQCAVALVDGDRAWRCVESMERGHAERLFTLIEQALSDAGVSYDAITRIGVCEGPGSFTGTRVAIAAARGLALGCKVPAIGISRFEALRTMAKVDGPCIVVIPARGEQVYGQCFDTHGAQVGEPCETGRSDARVTQGIIVGVGGMISDCLVDPACLARLAAERTPGSRPAPLYLRGADAALPRHGPPVVLDP